MASIREITCENEHKLLSVRACFSDESLGRLRDEPECEIRTCFQRDRDRVIHCNSFRRLKHKTQVFLSPEGDYYRTRLTHTLEVSQIGRTIAVALRLNETLTEAIALAHDLGHTPFGHAGERALDSVYPDGFKHYEQSLRVVDVIEKHGQGLNLTKEVRDGIERHTNGEEAFTLEGRIVRLADRIAYINHDIDDAIHAKVLSDGDIPREIKKTLGFTKSERISNLVKSCIENSEETICLDDEVGQAFDELHSFMYKSVYTNPACKSEESKAVDMVCWLYEYFSMHPMELPEEYTMICLKEGPQRAACDYIAGMTDRYAVRTFNRLRVPGSWMV